jgi:hypothetical protein
MPTSVLTSHLVSHRHLLLLLRGKSARAGTRTSLHRLCVGKSLLLLEVHFRREA